MNYYEVVFDTKRFRFAKEVPGWTQVQRAHDWGIFYEQEMLEAIRKQLEPGDVVFDVGANVGNHSIFMGTICRAEVHAIEGDPDIFEMLRHNLMMNRAGKVHAHQQLAGAERGWACITGGSRGNRQFSLPGPDTPVDCRLFPIIPLDEIKTSGPAALLKIDVEGFELQVLQGATRILGTERPLIYAEAATLEERNRLDVYLKAFGYKRRAKFNATPTYLWSV